jgi:hypothetical protein
VPPAKGTDELRRVVLGNVLLYQNADNALHREDGPAVETYRDDGTLLKAEYFHLGEAHREDGPAEVDYHKNGHARVEHHYVEGERHREDGPSTVVYYEDGLVKRTAYWRNDVLHRNDGPAEVHFDEHGAVIEERFCRDDEEISRSDAAVHWLGEQLPQVSPANRAALEWLALGIEQAERTRAFALPGEEEIALALAMHHNPPGH